MVPDPLTAPKTKKLKNVGGGLVKLVQNNLYSMEFQRAQIWLVGWLIMTFGIFTPGTPHHVSYTKLAFCACMSLQYGRGCGYSQLGYPTMKLEKLNAVREFMKGQAVLVLILTGNGKSLCYSGMPAS